MKVSSNQQYDKCFGAKYISTWNCKNAKGDLKRVAILSLEKSDLPIFNELSKFQLLSKRFDVIRRSIMYSTVKTIRSILLSQEEKFKKTKMFVAVESGKLCGMLVGNIPKMSSATNKIVYSSRHNSAKKEAEIDWLLTWNPTAEEKIQGVGKALVGEYFYTISQDSFKDVFVKSEIPEYSEAVYFYEKLGFEWLGMRHIDMCNKNTNKGVVDNFSDWDDSVIPMIITHSKIQETLNTLEKNMDRRESNSGSIELSNMIS